MASLSLTEAVKNLLERKFSENSILVWYDAGGTLEPIIDKAIPENVSLIKYEGSYLQIRAKIETEGHLEKKRLIYVPRKPLKPSWLRDYELFGEKIETNMPKLLTEAFGLRTKPELATILTSANCRRLASKWDEVLSRVNLPLREEDLEEGLVAALLDQSSKFDVQKAVLTFLGYPEDVKTRLEKSGLRQIFLELLQRNGFPPLEELDSKRIAAILLLSELIYNSKGIEEQGLKDTLVEKKHRKFWSNAVHEWASNTTLVESFIRWSQKIEKDYNIKERIYGVKDIANAESFKAVDDALLEEIMARVSPRGLKGILENAKFIEKLAEIRENKIWAREEIVKEWKVLRKALTLLKGIEDSLKRLADRKTSLLKDYFNQLWMLDQIYRELVSLEKNVKYPIRSKFIEPVAQRYQKWLEEINEVFTQEVSAFGKWPLEGIPSQNSFWERFVKPHRKVCIFFLDGLRFELQKRLVMLLKERGHKVKHTPMLAYLPSITEVCMTLLLPRDGEIRLETKNDKLALALNEEKIKSKEERKSFLRKIYKNKIEFLELDQLKRDPKDLLKEVKRASILIVLSTEIDKAGRIISSDFLNYLDALIEKVVSGLETVALMGYPKIIITTDHGFLIIPEPGQVKTVIDFSYKGLIVSRRYAVGQPPLIDGCFNLPLRDVGYNSEGEILFPHGISYLPAKGAKEMYIHGGVSLQECCIGVLEVEPQGLGERVDVKVKLSEPITTQIFRVNLTPTSTMLFPIPRRVKVEVWSKGEIIGEQKPLEIYREPREVWVRLKKVPKEVEIKIRDTETREVIYTRKVSVALEGYDELI